MNTLQQVCLKAKNLYDNRLIKVSTSTLWSGTSTNGLCLRTVTLGAILSAANTGASLAQTVGESAALPGERSIQAESLPDVKALNADSDYSLFFAAGVSKEIRNLALKQLFFSEHYQSRDGLDVYDEDYSNTRIQQR